MAKRKTAVFILGFHVDSALQMPGHRLGWHDLVIGDLTTLCMRGRATYGLQLAYEEGADVVFFSTGASRKDGLAEAEYTHKVALEHSHRIAAAIGITDSAFKDWLEPRAHFDIESQTTAQELRRNLALCHRQRVQRVFLVTNRFHAPRALRDACQVREDLKLTGLRIHASPPDDPSPPPVIFERRTRPDRPGLDWDGVLGAIHRMPPEQQAEAFEAVQASLARILS